MSIPTLSQAEIDTIRTLAPIVGTAVTTLSAVAAIINIKRRFFEWIAARAVRKQEARDLRAQEEALRVDWYAMAYRRLVLEGIEGKSLSSVEIKKLSPEDFHRMTIQEACAHLGDVPDWAASVKWARRKVARLK